MPASHRTTHCNLAPRFDRTNNDELNMRGKYYFLAVVLVLATAVVRYHLSPILGNRVPYMLFVVPVSVCALYGGSLPAAFATLLSAALALFFFVRPLFSFAIDNRIDAVSLAAFCLVSAIITLLGGRVQKLTRHLNAVNRSKDDFLAMLAHELRNPLAAITTAAELLKFVHADEKKLDKTRQVILRQTAQMSTLVDDLLDVSRLTRGLIIMEKKPIDIAAAVHGAVDQTHGQFEEKMQRLVLELPSEPCCVLGDYTRLVQVFANLLNNASKYTQKGGQIQLQVKVEHGDIKVAVSDNGRGLPQELLPRVFDLFVQAELTPERSKGGLGLGLAIVKSITEKHGGKVTARSSGLNQGSTFTVCLPQWIAPGAPTSIAAEVRSELAEQVQAGTGHVSLNVLIVDDNADLAQNLGLLLQACGHTVSVRTTARDALDCAYEDAFDAFLLDIGLPDVSGYELIRMLRQNPLNSNAKFIAFTGFGKPADKALAQEAGFDFHFTKPVDVESLCETLKNIGSERGEQH